MGLNHRVTQMRMPMIFVSNKPINTLTNAQGDLERLYISNVLTIFSNWRLTIAHSYN